MLFAALGLALDIVGAWILAVGLFRGPEMALLYPGGVFVRSPETVAAERSYGIVGGGLLTAGFIGQLLGALDLGPADDRHMAVIAGGTLLVVAAGLAMLLLELVRWVFLR